MPTHRPANDDRISQGLLRVTSHLVPRRLRDGWHREWTAEFDHQRRQRLRRVGWRVRRPTPVAQDLVRRWIEAFSDAIWLLLHEGNLDMLRMHFRDALRGLKNRPAYAATAVLTLACGLAATGVIASVVRDVLLSPLPYPDPDRLVSAFGQSDEGEQSMPSYPDFLDWREQSRSYSGMAAYRAIALNLTGTEVPERVQGQMVSASFFATLGVAPARGQVFSEGDGEPGTEPVAIVSESLWRRHLSSKNAGDAVPASQATLILNGESYRVIGVMEESFDFPRLTDVWIAIGRFRDDPRLSQRSNHGISVIARLENGVSRGQATTEISLIAGRLAEKYPETNAGQNAILVPLRNLTASGARKPLLVLACGVGLVLLIACANVAALMLARSAGRRGELRVRAVLGASSLDLTRQVLTESLVITGLAALLSLPLAGALLDLVPMLAPSAPEISTRVSLDLTTLTFAMAAALIVTLVTGLYPARQTSRLGTLAGRAAINEGQRARQALVIVQIAISLVLLVGAGLMTRSLVGLLGVHPGFEPEGLMAVSMNLPEGEYTEAERVHAFHRRVLEDAAALPGVLSVSVSETMPLLANESMWFEVEGRPAPSADAIPTVERHVVTRGAVRTFGLSLIEGRDFSPDDHAEAPPVALINETMARRYWSGESPVGRRFRWAVPDLPFETPWLTVAGVVADVRQEGLSRHAQPAHYLLADQLPPMIAPFMTREMFLAVRASTDPGRLVDDLRRVVARIDSSVPLASPRALREVIAASLERPRFLTYLLSLFSAFALALAALGLYGTMAFAVSHRSREIGIRMALGARPGQVLRMVLGQGMRLALLGLALGLMVAILGSRVLESQLFGVNPYDLGTFVLVSIVLLTVAGLASLLPAWRAVAIEPVATLRQS